MPQHYDGKKKDDKKKKPSLIDRIIGVFGMGDAAAALKGAAGNGEKDGKKPNRKRKISQALINALPKGSPARKSYQQIRDWREAKKKNKEEREKRGARTNH